VHMSPCEIGSGIYHWVEGVPQGGSGIAGLVTDRVRENQVLEKSARVAHSVLSVSPSRTSVLRNP